MEIGWDRLKANAYLAGDFNSTPNSKASCILYKIQAFSFYCDSSTVTFFYLPLLALVCDDIGCPVLLALNDPCLW